MSEDHWTEEQLKPFWEAIQADAGLQEKLRYLPGWGDPHSSYTCTRIAAIAKEAGFSISAEVLDFFFRGSEMETRQAYRQAYSFF
jgi:hypothetical protein